MLGRCANTSFSGACLTNGALLDWRVFQVFRIAVAIAVLSSAAFGKDIRLRNEVIHTPDKKEAAALKAQSSDAPADGLFLIQFNTPVSDAQREELLRHNVELLQAVPEDAFVARV